MLKKTLISALAVAALSFAACVDAQLTTKPLLFTCSNATEGQTTQPFASCPNGTKPWLDINNDVMVATGSNTAGSWKKYGPLPGTATVRICPVGSLLKNNGLDCKTADDTKWNGTFVQKSTLPAPSSSTPAPIGIDNETKLSWNPVTTNTDGTPVSLLGYNLYWDTVTPPKKFGFTIAPTLTAYTVEDLAPGKWYFAVTAVSLEKIESELSAIATKTIAAPPQPTVTLAATPTEGIEAVTVKLTWASSNASACTGAGGTFAGERPLNGELILAPISASQSYSITCTGAGGSATTAVSVSVSPRPSAPQNLSAQ